MTTVRTTRVGMAASSTYRSAKRYLDTEEAFTILGEQSAFNQFNRQQHQPQKKKSKAPPPKRVLVQKKNHILIKGILFEADTVTLVRNHLLYRSISISHLQNKKRRNHTYRTSI